MPICIAGMHRSGTSMIARVLNLCGLHLGRADDLIPPGPDNAEGFWEHRHFVAINDALLAAFGGTWDAPPPLPLGWHKDPKLTPAYRRAGELIREFRGSSGWGWKDPRNSLTLPFWRHLLPDVQVVVCLRNPLEVAASLRRRQGGVTPDVGLGLWLTYYHRLLGDLRQTLAVFTHYAAYFHDPVQEMRRVIDRLALPLAEE